MRTDSSYKFPGGGAPKDHRRRCSVEVTDKLGTPCTQWALVVSSDEHPVCYAHADEELKAKYREYKAFNVYKQKLGPKLKTMVEQATGIDPDEQIAVFEELALMRSHASNFVAVYSAAYEAAEAVATNAAATPEQKAAASARLTSAGQLMTEALQIVTDTCAKATKIQTQLKDRFSIHDLKFVIERIMMIHFSVAKDYPELVEAFAKAIDEELKLPQSGSTGTSLHPDDTAREFDASVPLVDPKQAYSKEFLKDEPDSAE